VSDRTAAGLILGFDHVQVVAPRTEDGEARARRFYGELLGLAEIPKPDALAGRGGAWYRCGDLALHVGLDGEFQPARRAHPAFLVSDLDAFRARLESAGLTVHADEQIPGYRRFETRDPFGNRLEFMQRIASSATSDTAGQAGTADDAVKARVRDQFARTAQAYVASSTHARGHDLARLVELAGPRPSDLALDVSTGGGHTALAVAPHVARVIASDLTPAMLQAARRFLAGQGVTNVEYVIADAESLPFLEDAFDLVTVRIAPHHYADVRAASRELARVLKPGGRLVLIDNIAPDDPALDAFMNEVERRRDPSHVRNYTEREWGDLLAAAGLTVTHAELDRKVHDFAEWTARSQMLPAERTALERDLLGATPDARSHFEIVERDGRVASWTSGVLILRADKPAA
jgi:ubiquinone/menaquinone biosynthesis C-methylase UbiE/catechol 2,3-dioxygenase-like lactoylglutathione lyase family enzyme